MADPKAPVLGKTRRPTCRQAVFTEDFHESLVHEAARADLNSRRRGTASTLGRGEVAMTGAKAWRQKGTGRARVGALSVPHRRGGGVAFGPSPARLHRQGQPQGPPPRPALRPVRPRGPRQHRRARRRPLLRALHQVGSRPRLRSGAPRTRPSCSSAPRRPAWPRAFATSPRGRPAGGRGRRRRLLGARLAGRLARPRSRCLSRARAEVTRKGGEELMDARQVIIEPVVSEKSYALMADGKYTFRIDDRAHKTQVSRRRRGHLRRDRGRRPHPAGALEAEASRHAQRPHPQLEEGDRPARPGRPDRAVRGRGGATE